MAKARRKVRRRLTPEEAQGRIDDLRGVHVRSSTAGEDLDQPIDPALRVTSQPPHHKLALVVDGETVSEVTVWDFEQQIGSATVRMGGIGGVGTRREHRFRGYSARVMESSLRWMRAEGFDVAMLYGIQSFYPRFGYAPAFPRIQFTMAVRDAERARPAGHRFVSFTGEHLRPVLRMYHRNNTGRTGPIRRDPRRWRPWRKGESYGTRAACKVALDRRGRPAGYLVHDRSRLAATVIEIGFATPAVFPDILRRMARHALRRRLERIKLLLPEDDAFIEFCKPFGLHKEADYRRDGGAMVRMIHIPRALGKVATTLGSRLSGSGQLTLRTNLDDVGLAWRAGRLSVGPPQRRGPQARLPQWALAQLLYGYRRADALAAEGDLAGSRWAVTALGELFPPQPHYHYLADHF